MLIKYKCNLCENEIKKLITGNVKFAGFLPCACGGVMEKQLPDFGVSSFETVDNGLMAKKVLIRKDATHKAREKGDLYIKTMENRDKILKKDE
jgi:hypothetical protein